MFNNTQKVNCIDQRLLPSNGLIKVRDFKTFVGVCRDDDVEKLLIDLKAFGVRIFEHSDNNRDWLICLDDFKNMNEEVE